MDAPNLHNKREFNGLLAGTDPANAQIFYDTDEAEFLKAIDGYQRRYGRRFPTFIEVLDVLKSLGYRKVAEPEPLPAYRTRTENTR